MAIVDDFAFSGHFRGVEFHFWRDFGPDPLFGVRFKPKARLIHRFRSWRYSVEIFLKAFVQAFSKILAGACVHPHTSIFSGSTQHFSPEQPPRPPRWLLDRVNGFVIELDRLPHVRCCSQLRAKLEFCPNNVGAVT
jgi:hypothetical protein